MVVQEVDGKEENNVKDPTADGDFVWCEKEPTVSIKLSDESCHSDEKKLNKCQKSPCNIRISLKGSIHFIAMHHYL